MDRQGLATILPILALAAASAADLPTAASWIWYPERPAVEGAGQTRYLRRALRLATPPASARLRLRADDSVRFTINGAPAPAPVENGAGGAVFDLAPALRAGENVLAFAVTNSGGPGGLIVTGAVRAPDGTETPIRSDTSFRAAREAVTGWDRPGFDDSGWPRATVVGNAFAAPWYGHSAFDLEPFIEPAERERWQAWRAALTRLPAGLAGESPARASLGAVNGAAALTIDGVPRPALVYRGTVDPMTDHGRRQIGLFRDAGVHVYAAYLALDKAWEDGPERFTRLDDTVRAYLSADPEAYLILLLRLVPPGEWMDRHPDELVRYAGGDDYNTSDEAGRVRRPSLASAVWRRDALAVWRAAIAHLEAQPWGKRVIGCHPCYGIYAEWHYYGSWTQQMPDTGPAMTAYFRLWLKQRYGTDERLRQAWHDPGLSLATATVPGAAPRQAADALDLRDPAQRAWVIDYYRCQQAITADDVEAFCAAAKEVTGGRVICGAFYGYFQGVLPQTQGGHLELARLLASPHIDYFAAPYDYSHRLMGDDGRTRAVVDAFTAAGKVHFIEADTRTHLHPLNEHGRVANTAQSVAAIRREVATALTHGSALWWCDFGADGSAGWYDQPELSGEIARLMKLAERRLQSPRRRVSQVTVVADLESGYALPDAAALQTHYRLVDGVTTELYRCGTPFDSVLLQQLAGLDLSDCRLLIFLNVLSVPPPLRSMIAKACAGRSVLWLWAPGLSDGNRLDPSLLTALTGFHVGPTAVNAQTVVCAGDQPLTRGVPRTTTWSLTPRQTTPVAGFSDPAGWYNPRDAKTMAERYSAFAWRAAAGAIRWDVTTHDSWTDIHLMTAITEPCDGFALDVRGEGSAPGLSLRVVVKDADAAEFVAPPFSVPRTPQTMALPLAGFSKAPWSRAAATAPRFPLTGAKFVLNGLAGDRPAALIFKAFGAVCGEVRREDKLCYGDEARSVSVLAIEEPSATALGRDAATGAVVLACLGEPGRRQVLSTVPFIPRQVLSALMDDAGVHRYVDSGDVIVRADSGLISLHTRVGGPCELRLPDPRTVRDALSGNPLGRGERLPLHLPADSTTLLQLE